MVMELQGWKTNDYLKFLDEVKRVPPSGYHFKNGWLEHSYVGNPIINPDGSIAEEYIERQDKDGQIYLDLVNKHFDADHELFSLVEVIVDERQLDFVDEEPLDLTRPSNVIGRLTRHPEVQDVMRHYVQRGGFVAVKADSNNKRFLVGTPTDIEVPASLKMNEKRFKDALSKVKYENKERWLSQWYENRTNAAFNGALTAYIVEYAFHPEWAYELLNFVGNINSGSLSELPERALEFIPTKEFGAIVAVALGFYLVPGVIRDFKRTRINKTIEDRVDVLKLLLNE